MPIQITKNQAADLYLAQLQSEAAKLPPVDRDIKRFMVTQPVTNRMIFMSYTDLITEVQNRTAIGMNKTVEYVQQLKDGKGEPMYQIVG